MYQPLAEFVDYIRILYTVQGDDLGTIYLIKRLVL